MVEKPLKLDLLLNLLYRIRDEVDADEAGICTQDARVCDAASTSRLPFGMAFFLLLLAFYK